MHKVSENPGLKGGPWLLLGAKDSLLNSLFLPLNTQVLVLKGNRTAARLSEVYRVESRGTLYRHEVAHWNRTSGLRWTRQLMYERRGQLHGLTVRVAVRNVTSLTELEECPTRGVTLAGGFFGHVWLTLQRSINIRSEYIISPKSRDRNAISRMVAQNEADVAFGDVTQTAISEQNQEVRYTLPVLTFRYEVYIRHLDWQELPWDLFLKPFSTRLWLTVVLTMLVSAVFLTLVQSLGHRYGYKECLTENKYSLYESLFLVISAICQQGMEETPQALSCRVAFIVIYFMALILLASYSAILISFLTIQRLSLPFTDLQGLIEDGSYQMGVLRNSTEHRFFMNTSDEMMQQLYEKFMLPDPKNFPETDEIAFERVCSMKFAFMIPFEYLSMIQSNISCSVVALPVKYFELNLSFVLPQNSFLLELLNYNLQVFRHSGLLQKMRELTWSPGESDESRTWVHVRLKHMISLLSVFGVGIILALVLLGLEKLYCSKWKIIKEKLANIVVLTLQHRDNGIKSVIFRWKYSQNSKTNKNTIKSQNNKRNFKEAHHQWLQ
ncbi:probable glutamate receptor [Anabrus simplex]|uniref:probable glutamate receptor n=1 Tax=Anabrus simplex TaxID=316456 RepID=UPI0035A2AEF5